MGTTKRTQLVVVSTNGRAKPEQITYTLGHTSKLYLRLPIVDSTDQPILNLMFF